MVMELIIDLLKSIAWPIAVVWLGYIFREDIQRLVSRFTSPELHEIDEKFQHSLTQAEAAAATMATELFGHAYSTDVEAYKKRYAVLQRLVETSPRAAILEAWVEVEAGIMAAAHRLEIEARGPIASRRVVEQLISQGMLSEGVTPLYQWLRDLRNSATHIPDAALELSDAERYFTLAVKFIDVLEVAAKSGVGLNLRSKPPIVITED